MCGICGKLNFERDRPVDRELLRRMMETIEHRGPDGGGEYIAGPVGLGHRRLSIIDLNTGSQPISNEDGTVWVVYNGEIYNYRELRTELEGLGHRFKSTSDTEVIVHLYEEMGDRCVTRFRGMFAFALWDDRRQRLLLARDRVGVKPLYYVDTGRALIFGSEIKTLLADTEVERRLNLQAIDRFVTYYYLPGEETLFAGVRKLAPGHFLTVQDGRVSVQQYWELQFDPAPRTRSFRESTRALTELLRDSVRAHMISDVPVGVLLSGGVDSTGVLGYAVERADRPLHTFTMGFSGANFADERPYARLAAEKLGTVHHETSLSAAEFRDFLPKYVWHMEEPVCEPPAVALYFVSRMAREASVKVLLSGEGGDEAFGGYQTYRSILMLERLKARLGAARGLLRAALATLGRAGSKRSMHYANLVGPDLSAYYLSHAATPFTPFNRLKSELYNPDFASAVGGRRSDLPTVSLFEHASAVSPLDRMLYVDTKTWLPDDLLLKADKMTMATSVELRVPLLDFRILEFAASLPQEYKVRGRELKRILKSALGQSVPRAILDRKKTGFPVPYDQWMRNEMKDFVFDTILSKQAALASYFRNDALLKLLHAHQRGEGSSKEVFSLLVLELWHRQFFQRPSPAK